MFTWLHGFYETYKILYIKQPGMIWWTAILTRSSHINGQYNTWRRRSGYLLQIRFNTLIWDITAVSFNFHWICYPTSNQKLVCISSDHGLPPVRQSEDSVYWRIYVSLCLDEITVSHQSICMKWAVLPSNDIRLNIFFRITRQISNIRHRRRQ